jgi:hypothetical protein
MRKIVMSAIVVTGLLVSGSAMAAQSLIGSPFPSGGSSFTASHSNITTNHSSFDNPASRGLMSNPVLLGNHCQMTTLPAEGGRGAPASVSNNC